MWGMQWIQCILLLNDCVIAPSCVPACSLPAIYSQFKLKHLYAKQPNIHILLWPFGETYNNSE